VVGPLADGSTGPLHGVPVSLDGNPASSDPGKSSVHDLATAVDGSWSTLVEPGSYRVLAAPTSDLPWTALNVNVYSPTVMPDLAVSAGRKVAGTLVYRNQDGTLDGIAGATVIVYRAPTSSVLQPMQLYQAVTDPTGSFTVVLPKAPDSSAQ
jgi:hypothetical protein